jgi:hypothetical protein
MSTHLALLTRMWRRRRPGRRDATWDPDPFRTLAVQLRLGRIAAEISNLERDQGRWARAHHLVAATAAYDDLLCEAAVLSGIPVPDVSPAVRRLMIEGQLRHQGWSW